MSVSSGGNHNAMSSSMPSSPASSADEVRALVAVKYGDWRKVSLPLPPRYSTWQMAIAQRFGWPSPLCTLFQFLPNGERLLLETDKELIEVLDEATARGETFKLGAEASTPTMPTHAVHMYPSLTTMSPPPHTPQHEGGGSGVEGVMMTTVQASGSYAGFYPYMVASDSGAMPPSPHDVLTASPNGITLHNGSVLVPPSPAAVAGGNLVTIGAGKSVECRYGDLCRVVGCKFFHPTRANTTSGPLITSTGRRACHSWLSQPTCRFGSACRDAHEVPPDWKCSNCTGNHRVMDCTLGYCVFARDRKCTWEQRFGTACPLPHPIYGPGAPPPLTPSSSPPPPSTPASTNKPNTPHPLSYPGIATATAVNARPVVASQWDPNMYYGAAVSVPGAATITNPTPSLYPSLLSSPSPSPSSSTPPPSIRQCHNCHRTDHQFNECNQPCAFFQRTSCKYGDRCALRHIPPTTPTGAVVVVSSGSSRPSPTPSPTSHITTAGAAGAAASAAASSMDYTPLVVLNSNGDVDKQRSAALYGPTPGLILMSDGVTVDRRSALVRTGHLLLLQNGKPDPQSLACLTVRPLTQPLPQPPPYPSLYPSLVASSPSFPIALATPVLTPQMLPTANMLVASPAPPPPPPLPSSPVLPPRPHVASTTPPALPPRPTGLIPSSQHQAPPPTSAPQAAGQTPAASASAPALPPKPAKQSLSQKLKSTFGWGKSNKETPATPPTPATAPASSPAPVQPPASAAAPSASAPVGSGIEGAVPVGHQRWAGARDCRFYAFGAGHCQHGDRCMFRHSNTATPGMSATPDVILPQHYTPAPAVPYSALSTPAASSPATTWRPVPPSSSQEGIANNDNLPYYCELCDRRFTSAKQLSQHEDGKSHKHRIAVRELFKRHALNWKGVGCENCGDSNHTYQYCTEFCRLWELQMCPRGSACPLPHLAL